MSSIVALNALRDSLRDNLSDPYVSAGGNSRTWVWTDEPLMGAKYPQIQLKKIDNPSSVLSIGPNYGEREYLVVNVWFYAKKGFKNTISGTVYKDEQLVEYYLGQIKTTLKADGSNLFDAGAKSYRHLNTTPVGYDENTQLHFAAVTVRVEYFTTCS